MEKVQAKIKKANAKANLAKQFDKNAKYSGSAARKADDDAHKAKHKANNVTTKYIEK